jgi:hypothetical protein
VRYAVTLPEVAVGGAAVPLVERVVEVLLDTGVVVELAAIAVMVDIEVEIVELGIAAEVYAVVVKDVCDSGVYLPPPPRNCGAAIVLDRMARIAPRRIAILILDRLFWEVNGTYW